MTPLNELIEASHVIRRSTVKIWEVDATLLGNI